MRVNPIEKREFIDLVYARPADFMRLVNEPQAFVVKAFYPASDITSFRNSAFTTGLGTEPTWHPLYDDCPDYHRLHDNYPKAYVKQKMHAFYYHGWYPHNHSKFQYFAEIFALKNFLAGYPERQFLDNIPSDGFIARINVHHYPRGGGYQAEHIDPVGKHAQIQTIVSAARFGTDFHRGGVYARASADAAKFYLDPFIEPGDLLVMSPGIHHGVEFIDPDVPYDWKTNDGRWMIMPIIVGSDYPNPEVTKPVQVASPAK